jgi:hypothetical protein
MKKIVPLLSFFFCLVFLSTILTVNAQTSIEITISSDKLSYNRGDVVTVSGDFLSDNQAINGLLGMAVVDTHGNNIAIRTVSTGTINNPLGTVTSAYLSDQSTNKLTSTSAGELAYFTISVINNDYIPRDLRAIINVYDNNGVSLSIGSAKFIAVPSGEECTAMLSVVIPSEAAGGLAYAYGGLYSEWPNQGGYPLAQEVSIPFTLIGAIQGSNQHSTSSGNQGSYELSFKLANRATLGQDNVYVISRVDGIIASNMVSFVVKQLGDFNGDGVLDFEDVVIFADNWIAYHSGQPWNPIVDLTKDSKLGFEDVVVFADAWIKYYNGV